MFFNTSNITFGLTFRESSYFSLFEIFAIQIFINWRIFKEYESLYYKNLCNISSCPHESCLLDIKSFNIEDIIEISHFKSINVKSLWYEKLYLDWLSKEFAWYCYQDISNLLYWSRIYMFPKLILNFWGISSFWDLFWCWVSFFSTGSIFAVTISSRLIVMDDESFVLVFIFGKSYLMIS